MTTETLDSIRDRLYSIQGDAPAPAAPAAPPARPAFNRGNGGKPNTYGGYCTECGKYVVAGAGFLNGKVNGKWAVKHANCSEVPASEPAPVHRQAAPAPVPSILRTADGVDPHPGIYTVESAVGHTTFRVYLQPEDDDFMPGKLLLELLVGSDNTGSYKSFGRIEGGTFIPWKKNRQTEGNEAQWFQDLRVLFTNPEAVLTAKNCRRCNRILTTPESLARGCGDVCYARGHA
jgi:hypothetical protein